MYESLKRTVLVLLRVPPEPAPPAGSPGSLRVFRASEKWYRLRLALWALQQIAAIAGIVLFLAIPWDWVTVRVPPKLEKILRRIHVEGTGPPRTSDGLPSITWADLEGLVTWLEVAGIAVIVLQGVGGLALVRIDWEMRWYMTTDRSLRVREGTWRVREQTLTLANVQNVSVEQNPVERFLGLANVKVRTAGGGDGGSAEAAHQGERLHVAVLRHVEDAEAIRDLILARLRAARDAGLGDPEDRVTASVAPGIAADAAAVAAARDLLAEVRTLRAALEGGG